MMDIDPYYISLIVVIAGAFAGMVLPYLIKCYQEPDIKFDFSYFYMLLVTMFISAVMLIPAAIAPSPEYYISLFLAGLGLQTMMAKARSSKK